jgi:hypothetical protein
VGGKKMARKIYKDGATTVITETKNTFWGNTVTDVKVLKNGVLVSSTSQGDWEKNPRQNTSDKGKIGKPYK